MKAAALVMIYHYHAVARIDCYFSFMNQCGDLGSEAANSGRFRGDNNRFIDCLHFLLMKNKRLRNMRAPTLLLS